MMRAVLGDDAVDEMQVAGDAAQLRQDSAGDEQDDHAGVARRRYRVAYGGSTASPCAIVPS